MEVHEDFSRYKGQGRWLFKDDRGTGFDAEATIKMLDECILWLREKIESDSKSILHVLDITTYLGVTSAQWYRWKKYDKRVAEKQELIGEMIASKVHNDGLRNKINVIGAIFSLKNQKADMFKDKQEVEQTNIHRIDSISVGEAKDNKRLDNAEIKEIEDVPKEDSE